MLPQHASRIDAVVLIYGRAWMRSRKLHLCFATCQLEPATLKVCSSTCIHITHHFHCDFLSSLGSKVPGGRYRVCVKM